MHHLSFNFCPLFHIIIAVTHILNITTLLLFLYTFFVLLSYFSIKCNSTVSDFTFFVWREIHKIQRPLQFEMRHKSKKTIQYQIYYLIKN